MVGSLAETPFSIPWHTVSDGNVAFEKGILHIVSTASPRSSYASSWRSAICIVLRDRTVHSTRWSNILSENRDFCLSHLHSTAALKGEGWFPPEYCHNVWYGKPRMMATGWWKIVGYVCSFRQNTRTWQTDRWTETMRRDSPHLCRTSLGKNGAWKTHSPGIVFPGNVLSAKRNPLNGRTLSGSEIFNGKKNCVVFLRQNFYKKLDRRRAAAQRSVSLKCYCHSCKVDEDHSKLNRWVTACKFLVFHCRP